MPTSNKRRTLQFCAPVTDWSAVEAAAPGTDGERPTIRRFNMTAYTGGPMVLAGWQHPVVVDLAGLQVSAKSRPILKDHNRSLIVGHTDSISVQGSSLQVTGVISGAGAVAREIVESSRNGFPWQSSLGAIANPSSIENVPKGRKAQVNGREFEGPIHIARKSTLGEISFVALGADDNTTASVAETAATAQENQNMNFEQWLEAKGFDLADLNDDQRASLQAIFDAEPPEAAASRTTVAASNANADVIAQIRAGAVTETGP